MPEGIKIMYMRSFMAGGFHLTVKVRALQHPSAQGQSKALKRAYAHAPYDMDSLKFLEGHGTGTTLGDRIELEGIAMAMGDCAFKSDESPSMLCNDLAEIHYRSL
jgi:3-oxoacyl-(acyl-carrier-protein) synthase